MNTDSPLDEIDLMIAKIDEGNPQHYTQRERIMQAIELYCHKQVIEELEHIDFSLSSSIKDHTVGMTIIKNRIAELRETL